MHATMYTLAEAQMNDDDADRSDDALLLAVASDSRHACIGSDLCVVFRRMLSEVFCKMDPPIMYTLTGTLGTDEYDNELLSTVQPRAKHAVAFWESCMEGVLGAAAASLKKDARANAYVYILLDAVSFKCKISSLAFMMLSVAKCCTLMFAHSKELSRACMQFYSVLGSICSWSSSVMHALSPITCAHNAIIALSFLR